MTFSIGMTPADAPPAVTVSNTARKLATGVRGRSPNAANAAYAAISMQTQVSAMTTSRGASLRIHAGFHYGPVIDDSKDVFGDSVNLAARLTSLAKSGQTLLSADTLNILSPSLRSRTRST